MGKSALFGVLLIGITAKMTKNGCFWALFDPPPGPIQVDFGVFKPQLVPNYSYDVTTLVRRLT